MQAQSENNDLNPSSEAIAVSKQVDDQIGFQKRQQQDIAEFRAWSLRNLLPEHIVLFSLVDEDLKKAFLQSEIAVKQSISVSQSARKILFKPEAKQIAANKGGKQNFRANQNGKIDFTPLLAVPLPVDEKLRKTKQTVQDKRRIQFRKDVANINGPSPKILVEKAKTTIRDYDGDDVGTQGVAMTTDEKLDVTNSPYAPKKKKKNPYGPSR